MALIWSKIVQKLINAVSFKNATKKEDNDPPPVPRSELYIPQSVIDCYYAGQRENNTREWVRFVIEGLTLAIGIGGFVMLYQTLNATWEAVAAARTEAAAAVKQLELSQRPWVVVDVVPSEPITFESDDQAHLSVHVTLRNVGHSVATKVFVDDLVVLFSYNSKWELENFDEPRERRDELCESVRRRIDDPRVAVWTLFPERERVTGRGVNIGGDIIGKRAFTIPNVPGRFISMVFVGCVGYQFTFTPERHVVGFAYGIHSTNQTYGGSIRVGEPLPIEGIRLQEFAFAGEYID